jgi:hypothetical protein
MYQRLRLVVIALTAAVVAPVVLSSGASAATSTLWAAWIPLTGSSGAFTSSVTVANSPGLIADVTTDSRSGQVGVISGVSTWLGQGTPVGAKYGSSINQPYLNLRPKADTPSAPSTTTYSFRTPTPDSGWTFVLGDIDADQVQVRAIGPNGAPLTAAQLGFQGGFNYCAPGVAGKPSCTGVATEVPSWNPVSTTLIGNAAATDTSGSAAWFEPNAPISSLTFVFTQRSGFPVYQTWFASLARDITGAVTDTGTGPAAGVPVTLIDGTGAVVATTTTAADGGYAFTGVLATDGYTVSVTPPVGKISDDSMSKPADLRATDAVVDFTIRDIVPVAVRGKVVDSSGQPIPGATVHIAGLTATTAPDGTYVFDKVPPGDHTVTITDIDGYTVTSAPLQFTISAGDTQPITGQDFVLTPNPDVSGTVSASGTGVPGVTVTATGAGGDTVSTVTAADGTYTFSRVPAGAYTMTMIPPADYVIVGGSSQPVTVANANVTGVDFALARTGSVTGVVIDETGATVPGATVTVDGPSGSTSLTTDPNGAYGLGSLAPGPYTITLTVPAGYTSNGPLARSVTITANGEAFADQDFALIGDPITPTTPPTPPAPTPTSASSNVLADTGSNTHPALALWTAGGALTAGAASIALGAVRHRRSA